MADIHKIEQIIENAVASALDKHLAEARAEAVRAAMAELEPLLAAGEKPAEAAPAEAPATSELFAAVATVQDSTAQADILRNLVEGAAKFAGRAALLVVRSGTAVGWQGRGFDDNEQVKSLKLDTGQGLVGRAYSSHTPAAAAAAEFDSGFIAAAGNPHDGNALVLPLVVKDKVAALLYADAGTDPSRLLDSGAVQVLVRSTSLWLEVLALRKTGGTAAAEAEPEHHAEPAPAAMAAAAPTMMSAPPPAAAPEPPPPPAPPVVESKPAPAEAALPPEEAELHKKAKRFAKLLVDEIKLYNQQKVADGRANRDLYDRLREDIDKSRATYEKRYGSTAAAGADYFRKEVIRILADNDESLLGSNFSAS
jgi:hypothetical protein